MMGITYESLIKGFSPLCSDLERQKGIINCRIKYGRCIMDDT
jgi:hypothetical protein